MNLENLTPLHDQILVERCVEETRYGLIVIPDAAKEKPQEGIVRAVGEGRISKKTGKRLAMDVKVGDRVLFAKYAGTANKIGSSEDLLIMREDDIMAVIDQSETMDAETSQLYGLGEYGGLNYDLNRR